MLPLAQCVVGFGALQRRANTLHAPAQTALQWIPSGFYQIFITREVTSEEEKSSPPVRQIKRGVPVDVGSLRGNTVADPSQFRMTAARQ